MRNGTKVILSILGYGSLMAAVFFSTTGIMNLIEKNSWKIPQANDMAAIAMQAQHESESFDRLEKRVSASIRVDAKKGARETEVYIGEFSKESRKEIIRKLAFTGYKTELESPLSGKNDFLKISW